MIPAFINVSAAGTDELSDVLTRVGGFAIHRVEPTDLRERIRASASRGAMRVVVAGGDGSLRTAAEALAGTRTELAVLPGGTLNHFASDLGIPMNLEAAANLAKNGHSRPIDIARANGIAFLNTSSVGSYATFVQRRDRFERLVGYRFASFLSATSLFARLPNVHITLEAGGVRRSYTTPLVFIGVGERELKLPTLGSRLPAGQSSLHVMVIRRRSGARVLALALAAATRGVHRVARTPALDAFRVDQCTVETTHHTVALDGELLPVTGRLHYEIERNGMLVVAP